MQPLSLPFLYHRLETTCQVDCGKVSNSKLKPDLCKCVITEIIESMAPSQQPHKGGTITLGHPAYFLLKLYLQIVSKMPIV